MDAEDIKKLRLAAGLTQQGLADRMGVDKSTVWRWENGAKPGGLANAFLHRLQEEIAPQEAAS